MELRNRLMSLLQDESELEEIVKLVGIDALSPGDRLKMEAARSIREDFLHQLAYHEVDTYTSLKKQLLMIRLILAFYDIASEVMSNGGDIEIISSLPVREQIGRFKYIKEENTGEEYEKILNEINAQLQNSVAKEEI